MYTFIKYSFLYLYLCKKVILSVHAFMENQKYMILIDLNLLKIHKIGK